MTFDYKKPFTTSDGRKARLLADDLNNSHQLVVAIETPHMKIETIRVYMKDGIKSFACSEDTLVNIPERKERWKCVWADFLSVQFKTRAEAEKFIKGCKNQIGLLRIVYEDDRIVDQEYFPLHGETQ